MDGWMDGWMSKSGYGTSVKNGGDEKREGWRMSLVSGSVDLANKGICIHRGRKKRGKVSFEGWRLKAEEGMNTILKC